MNENLKNLEIDFDTLVADLEAAVNLFLKIEEKLRDNVLYMRTLEAIPRGISRDSITTSSANYYRTVAESQEAQQEIIDLSIRLCKAWNNLQERKP